MYLLGDGSSVPLIFGAEELYFFEREEERVVQELRAQLRLFESGAEACPSGLKRLPWASLADPAAADGSYYTTAAGSGEEEQDSPVSSSGSSSSTTAFSDGYRYAVYLGQRAHYSVAAGAAAEEAAPHFEIGFNGYDDSDSRTVSSELSTARSSEESWYGVVNLDQRRSSDSGAGGEEGEGPLPSESGEEDHGYAHDDSGISIFLGPSSGEGARGVAVYLDRRRSPYSVAGGEGEDPPSPGSGGNNGDVYEESGMAIFLDPFPSSSYDDDDDVDYDDDDGIGPRAVASATEPETQPAVRNSYVYYGMTSTASSPVEEAEALVASSTAEERESTATEPAAHNSYIYYDFSFTESSPGEGETSSSSAASGSEFSASAAAALEPSAVGRADGGEEPPRMILDSGSGSGYPQQLLEETDDEPPSFGDLDEKAASSFSSREDWFAPPPTATTAGAAAGASKASSSSSAAASAGASSATDREDYTDEGYGYYFLKIYGAHREGDGSEGRDDGIGGGGDGAVSSTTNEEPESVVVSSDPAIEAEGGDYPPRYSSNNYGEMISRLFEGAHAAAAAAALAVPAVPAAAAGAAAPGSGFGTFAGEEARASPYLAFDEDGSWSGGFVSEETGELAPPPLAGEGDGEGTGDGVGGAALAIN